MGNFAPTAATRTANSGSGTVTPIDVATNTALAAVTVGNTPPGSTGVTAAE